MLGSMTHSLTVRGCLKSLPRTLPKALFLTLILCLASACGNKGPLYLPDEPMPAQASAAMEEDTGAEEEPEKDDGDG